MSAGPTGPSGFPLYNGVEVLRLPPEGIVPDFDNPRSQKVLEHYLIFGIGGSLATIALCQRYYTKIFLSKGLGIDDVFMFLGWACAILTQVLLTVSIREKGLCHHSWEMPLDDFERYALLAYVSAPIYMMCNGFVKLSLLTFYLHLSPQKWFRVAVWISIGIVAVYTIIITFMLFFNCVPPRRAFDFSIKEGKCIDAAILYMATAVSNIITDVMLFVLPLPMVYRLHMPKAQKVGAVLVFGVGSVTVATSIVRLILLPSLLKSTDVSFDAAPANIWSFIEGNLFVICGSMPTLRRFFKHFAPQLMGSSGTSQSNTYGAGYHNQQRSGTLSRVHKSRQYAQFSEEDAMEMDRYSDDNNKMGTSVAVGVATPDVQRDDHIRLRISILAQLSLPFKRWAVVDMSLQWALAYTAMLSTTFLFALDNAIVSDIQPAIINNFSNIELLPWIGTGFPSGNMSILSWGKAYGIFNVKWIYPLNIALFAIGSNICGAAPSINALIVGRIIAEKPVYLAGSTVMWEVGSVLGPVVGGAFASSSATWRWGFYINLVVGAAFAPVYIMLFPNIISRPGTTLVERVRMMDWLMTAIFLAGSCCLTMAISFGGLVDTWDSGAMITLWVSIGVLLFAAIIATKYHSGLAKEDRLYPAHYFKDPLILNMQLQLFLSSGNILSGIYHIHLYFQFARGMGREVQVSRLLPLIVAMVVFSMINGVLMPIYRYISPWYIIGSALAVSGAGLMCTIDENTNNGKVCDYLILIDTGCGCYIVAGFAIAQAHVPPHDIANAVSAMTIGRFITILDCSSALVECR
ncbi:Efflux pump DEP3 [Paramyrothecium foliicola]|nr:Efflux pump DEP3 [Paramyrothecium foliicola]